MTDRRLAHRGQVRLLACDIDGTLLDSQGILRPSVRRAVATVVESGVPVILASGRSPWGMIDTCRDLGLDGPQITMQGGLIVSPATGAVVQARELSADDVRAHVAFARAHGLQALVSLPDGYYAEPSAIEEPRAAIVRRVRVVPSLLDVGAWLGAGSSRPIRTFLFTPPDRNGELRAAAQAHFQGRYSVVWADATGFELLAPGTNKGAALRFMADRLGLPMEAVAAVGDGWNDLEMLQVAGASAAMGSAPAEVRAAARMVVPTSDEDGVVEALRSFFPDLRWEDAAA